MKTARILLADSHPQYSRRIQELLEQQPLYRVVGTARSADEVFELVDQLKPDLLITDLNLPDSGSFSMIRTLRRTTPAMKIIALTLYHSPAFVKEAFAAGIDGYVNKEQEIREFKNVVDLVLHGPPR